MQCRTYSVGSGSWRRRIASKLRFSFSNSRLDQTLSTLRTLNEDFGTLSAQTLASSSLRTSSHTPVPQRSYHEVKRYKAIGQASRNVYESLGNACTKHTEHQAHFGVEVGQAVMHKDHTVQVKFTMAYTHLTLAGSANQGDLVWFVIDSTTGEGMQIRHSNAPSELQI